MIKAIKDKVVAILMTRDKTSSGIIIPDSVQEAQAFCKVLSVGEDVTAIKVNNIIVAHIRGGMDVVIDREIIKVLKEEEIYGVLTDRKTLSTLKEIELNYNKSRSNKKSEPSKIIQI